MMGEGRKISVARQVATVGLMAASLECVKLALSALPNIEAVTLLVAVFSYAAGWTGVLATVVFVCIEPLIWGFGTWVISYALYWPALALLFLVLGRLRVKNRVAITSVAVGMTLWFGVLTSLVDIGLFSGRFDNFFHRFEIYYARGAVFYALQVASNLVLFPLLFRTLTEKLKKLT